MSAPHPDPADSRTARRDGETADKGAEPMQTQLDRLIETDTSEVVDEPSAERRAFFRRVYASVRENFEELRDADAYQFTLDFTRRYDLASEAFVWRNVSEWMASGEVAAR